MLWSWGKLQARTCRACRGLGNSVCAGARPRNAAGLSCGVPPPERARQRVGQKVAWMPHPVTSVTTRERPSPRAAAPFRPSAHDKPQRHENCLRSTRKRPLCGLHEKRMGRQRRSTRKRPLRGLHEKRMGRLRRVARNCPLRGLHEKHTKSARGGYTGGDNRAWATRKARNPQGAPMSQHTKNGNPEGVS